MTRLRAFVRRLFAKLDRRRDMILDSNRHPSGHVMRLDEIQRQCEWYTGHFKLGDGCACRAAASRQKRFELWSRIQGKLWRLCAFLRIV